MAKMRYINTRFWNDAYISELDPSEKLLFLYCLTNPTTNISGAYEIPLKIICADTGFDKELVIKLFKRFEKDNKIIYKDGWVLVLNFILHQNVKSKDVRNGMIRELKSAPEWLQRTVYRRSMDGGIYLNLNLDLKPIPIPIQETNPEPIKDNKPTEPKPEINLLSGYIYQEGLDKLKKTYRLTQSNKLKLIEYISLYGFENVKLYFDNFLKYDYWHNTKNNHDISIFINKFTMFDKAPVKDDFKKTKENEAMMRIVDGIK